MKFGQEQQDLGLMYLDFMKNSVSMVWWSCLSNVNGSIPVKVQQSRNVFSSWWFFQKRNEGIQFFGLTVIWLGCFVRFFEEFEDSEKYFRDLEDSSEYFYEFC